MRVVFVWLFDVLRGDCRGVGGVVVGGGVPYGQVARRSKVGVEGTVVTVDNKISDSITTLLAGRANSRYVNTAVGLFRGRSVKMGERGAYYSLSSIRSTEGIYCEVKVECCIFGFSREFGRSIVSHFISTCRRKTAPGPYVSYGHCLGFSGVFREVHRLRCSCVMAKRCTHIRCSRRGGHCLLGGTISSAGSRDCILCVLARRRLTRVSLPLNKLHGARIHRVTRGRNFIGTEGRSDRSVYFMPSNSCTGFVRRCAKHGSVPNSFMSARKGVLNGRGKVVRCALNREEKLNVPTTSELCIYSVSPGAGRIILKGGRSLFRSRLATAGIGLVSYRSLGRPVELGTGVHCHRPRRRTMT